MKGCFAELTAIYRFNKTIATTTIWFIVTVAIVVYKGFNTYSLPNAYRYTLLEKYLVSIYFSMDD